MICTTLLWSITSEILCLSTEVAHSSEPLHGQTATIQDCPFLSSPRSCHPLNKHSSQLFQLCQVNSAAIYEAKSHASYPPQESKDTVSQYSLAHSNGSYCPKEQDPFNPSWSSCTTMSPCPLLLVHIWLQVVSKLSKLIQQNVCSLFQQYQNFFNALKWLTRRWDMQQCWHNREKSR